MGVTVSPGGNSAAVSTKFCTGLAGATARVSDELPMLGGISVVDPPPHPATHIAPATATAPIQRTFLMPKG
ncbi:Uncharacterised protein [Mycobacteroides abscessus subsp. abscessus]|nr:Uncharacterised protein [Mycobacteroides abscessus subsp. abscessus]